MGFKPHRPLGSKLTLLEKKVGPLRLRAWGLAANLIANAIALLGLARLLTGHGGLVLLITGSVLTIMLITLLSFPDRYKD